LGGTGTINLGTGSLVDVAAGGSLAPGAGVGTLTVNGDVSLDGTLANEISGSSTDLLAVDGDLTLGATSILDLVGTLTGSSYTIASYTGTLQGTFGSISGLGSYRLDYGTGLNSEITLQAVPAPEPSSFLLLGFGVLGLICRARRRNFVA
jgi:fibronectin-binding autotransporter adhesin